MTFKTTTFAAFAALFSAAAAAGPVNINTADATTLDQELTGVGPVISQRVVEWREANGPFQHKAQLAEVKGIGSKTLERNEADILLK